MQVPIAFTPAVLVEVVPFLDDDGLSFNIHVQDSALTWKQTAVVITGPRPSEIELRELGRIVFLGATS